MVNLSNINRKIISYGCSYFFPLTSSTMQLYRLSRFQESAKQEEAAIHKLLPLCISLGLLSGSSPKHLSRAWLFVLPHLNNGDTGSALHRSLRSVKQVWGPPPRSGVGQRLFLRYPSPFGVLKGPFCQPCYLLCFKAQWSGEWSA